MLIQSHQFVQPRIQPFILFPQTSCLSVSCDEFFLQKVLAALSVQKTICVLSHSHQPLPNFIQGWKDKEQSPFRVKLHLLLLCEAPPEGSHPIVLFFLAKTHIPVFLTFEKFDPFVDIWLHRVNEDNCLISVHQLWTVGGIFGSRKSLGFLKHLIIRISGFVEEIGLLKATFLILKNYDIRTELTDLILKQIYLDRAQKLFLYFLYLLLQLGTLQIFFELIDCLCALADCLLKFHHSSLVLCTLFAWTVIDFLRLLFEKLGLQDGQILFSHDISILPLELC